MTEQYEKLKDTLAEIFQLDQADLDFGIYRIMNQKRDEINAFLDKKLLEDVKEVLAQSTSQDNASLKEELDNLIKALKSAGINPEDNDKVKELKTQYQSAGSPEVLINEVFSHLTNFFRRYYHQGDFISQRRYKKDVYAIPYEGEEVKLHWANHDQYYIKTGENFKNYTFNLPDGLKVSFVLREASTDQNNNKTQQGKERRFKLVSEDIFTFENGSGDVLSAVQAEEAKHLKISFTYEPEDKKIKQNDLRQTAAKTIKSLLPANFRTGLLQPKPTEKNKERTLLDKHLQDYMAKNTFDYFIHKDLGGFLNRELDFYIKNEVLEIDDINLDGPQSFERQLRIIKALKTIARKLIALMAQLEDFQKKLWLKKKMVIQSDYCITLDRVPEDMYPDILKNQAQIQEWNKLFAILDIKKEKGGDLFSTDTVTYAEVFDKEGQMLPGAEMKGLTFMKANTFLVLDTQFFDREWKYNLLASISDLDHQNNGLLVNSENFQALRFLQERYKNKVKLIYVDPPFNTGSDFPYKDTFQDSSWLSLMYDRIKTARFLLSNDGSMYQHLDYNANFLGRQIMDFVFGKDNFLNEITWQRSTTVGSSKAIAKRFPTLSDTLHLYVNSSTTYFFNKQYLPPSEEYKSRFREKDDYGYFYWNTLASYSQETYEKLLSEKKVRWSEGAKFPQYKTYLHELKGNVIPDVWTDINMLNPMSNERSEVGFLTQKPEKLLKRIIETSSLDDEIVLDFFLGSGTTVSASIKNGRKFLGIEMGEYFKPIVLPRIKRSLSRKAAKNTNGSLFKYLRLESYEDTLNNLELKRSSTQQSFLGSSHFGEEYLLNYMLEVESRNSLLNLDQFKRPFGYKLKVTENNELREQEVDLVETFNYLIGLVVKSMEILKDCVVVQGHNLAGEKILVIWRDVDKTDNVSLNDFFRKLDINTRDSEFKRIYVNGDNNLENIRTDEEGTMESGTYRGGVSWEDV